MNELVTTLLYAALGFLSGSVLYCRFVPLLLLKKDICALSPDKNPGAANVFAVCGVPMGLLCLALDMLKAYLPVSLAAQHLDTQSVWFALALAAPVLGHAVGVFNGFHGGKCIASAFGAMLALALTGVSLSGLLLLAGLYIFFSVAVKIRPHRLRSMLVFALHGEGALALGCGMIAVTGVLRHTRRFCVLEDEKPRISNSEF